MKCCTGLFGRACALLWLCRSHGLLHAKRVSCLGLPSCQVRCRSRCGCQLVCSLALLRNAGSSFRLVRRQPGTARAACVGGLCWRQCRETVVGFRQCTHNPSVKVVRVQRPNLTFERTPNMRAPFHSALMFSAAQLNVRHQMRQLLLATAIALSACESPNEFATVQPQPKSSAWWLRLSIKPNTSDLRGIPANQLNSGWCKFTEYETDLFLQSDETRQDLLGEYKKYTTFSVAGPITNGIPTDFVVGAYSTCEGKTGTAVALITKPPNGKPQSISTIALAEPAQWATLHSLGDEQVEVWWCFACDNITSIKWNSINGSVEYAALVNRE